jgi:hypothetical protein
MGWVLIPSFARCPCVCRLTLLYLETLASLCGGISTCRLEVREVLGGELVVKKGSGIAVRCIRRLWLLLASLQSSERYVESLRIA